MEDGRVSRNTLWRTSRTEVELDVLQDGPEMRGIVSDDEESSG